MVRAKPGLAADSLGVRSRVTLKRGGMYGCQQLGQILEPDSEFYTGTTFGQL